MKIRNTTALLLFGVALAAANPTHAQTSTGAGREQRPLRLSATLVQIPTVVTDQSGRFIADLSKNDFAVFEDGKKQDIAAFATVTQPFTAVLVIDTSNSAADRLKAIQDAAIDFLRQIRTDDRASVIAFDNEVHQLTEFTSSRAELEAAIRGTESGYGKLLYEAMTFALEKLRQIEGRRAVVLFSDAVDMRSVEASAEGTIRLAEEIGAVVYVVKFETRWWIEAEARKHKAEQSQSNIPFSVDVRIPLPPELGGPDATPTGFPKPGRPKIEIDTGQHPNNPDNISIQDRQHDPITQTLDKMYGEADAFSQSICLRTGGRVFSAESLTGTRSAFAAIADELRNQYLLGYYTSADRRDGGFRKIKVEVKRKGAQVRARAGYREPGPWSQSG